MQTVVMNQVHAIYWKLRFHLKIFDLEISVISKSIEVKYLMFSGKKYLDENEIIKYCCLIYLNKKDVPWSVKLDNLL